MFRRINPKNKHIEKHRKTKRISTTQRHRYLIPFANNERFVVAYLYIIKQASISNSTLFDIKVL